MKRLNLSQNLLIDLDPQVFRHLDRLETLDLSSNFLMGLSEEFFREVEDKDSLKMVYLQVGDESTQVQRAAALVKLSLFVAEQPVEMRSVPHQATAALSPLLPHVLGLLLQAGRAALSQVRWAGRRDGA